MQVAECRIGFIGFGHMAQILFRSMDRAKVIPRSHVLFVRRNPQKMKESQEKFGITATSLETLVDKSDLIFLCVRPNQAKDILQQLASIGIHRSSKMILSIIAGLKLASFDQSLGAIPVIRAMPNLASEIGEGMTILTYGPQAGKEFESIATFLFRSMGEVVELPEQFMDLATGLAGSGPAFVFSLIEAAARLGEKEGIDYEKALKMAAQTFLGAARVLLKGGSSVQDLIHRIVVPHGTTEAGLKVFKELAVDKHFQAVIKAAAQRSAELGQEHAGL